MLRSMTGFGQASKKVNGYQIQVDIRSVNHRYQEISIRMPREFLQHEDSLKKLVQNRTSRGRIEMYISIERDTGSGMQVKINWSLIDGYHQAADQLAEKYDLISGLTAKDLIFIPEAIRFQDQDPSANEWMGEQLGECVSEAINQLVQMREIEGQQLYIDITKRIQTLKSLQDEMIQYVPQFNLEYRKRLQQRIHELLETTDFDEHRFTMEVALMAEKANIEEELTRLFSHYVQFEQYLNSDLLAGRKLDFLIQEMNREVNTIGSKSNGSNWVNHVVDMKAELEKIREQIQNVE